MDTNKTRIANLNDLIAATDRGTLSPAEVAAVMGVDHRTIEDGQLQCIELGKLKRIPRHHVLDMLGLGAA